MATVSRDDGSSGAGSGWATVPTPEATKNLARPVIVIAIVVAVALLLPLIVLPQTSGPRANRRANEYHSAIVTLHNDLPETQATLVVLTEPSSRSPEHAALLPALGDSREHVEAAADVASRRMPFAWPLASSEPFDKLAPVRATLAESVRTADALLADLVALINYRAVYGQMFSYDDLPLAAPSRFDRFIGRLAEDGAADADLLGELPRIDALDGHRSSVGALVRRLDPWIDEYTGALFIGDIDTVNQLLTELNTQRRALNAELLAELSRIRRSFDETVLQLAADLEDALVVLEG